MPTPKFFPAPTCTIKVDAASGFYGFTTRFDGRLPHDQMTTFASVEDVLAWVDPHKELVWEPASDADESKIMESRAYKPGSVPWCCQTLPARACGVTRAEGEGR